MTLSKRKLGSQGLEVSAIAIALQRAKYCPFSFSLQNWFAVATMVLSLALVLHIRLVIANQQLLWCYRREGRGK